MDDLAALTKAMADALVAHVPTARRDADGTVHLGFGGLRAQCEVTHVHSPRIVELHVWLTGGALAPAWIEDTWAGFGPSPAEAVVLGVHDWIEGSFGAVRAAFAGGAPARTYALDGAPGPLFASALSLRGDASRFDALSAAAVPDLASCVLAADALPWLPPERPHTLGCFVARTGAATTLEVKLDGVGWPSAHDALTTLRWPAGEGYLSVRELVVLGARAASHAELPAPAALRRTLSGLAASEHAGRVFGAAAHRFELAAPLDEPALDALVREAGITLPADYRAFVAGAGRAGAGPGYGLLSPDHRAQRGLARGTFPATEGEVACDAQPAGVLALAHHGCGYMSLLVVEGAHRGEVWLDLRGADRGLVRTDASFTAWYRAWLAALVSAYAPPVVGEPSRCAMPKALSAFLVAEEKRHGRAFDASRAVAALPPGSIATASDGSPYFEPGDPLDLCSGCVDVAWRLGARGGQIAPGRPPLQAR